MNLSLSKLERSKNSSFTTVDNNNFQRNPQFRNKGPLNVRIQQYINFKNCFNLKKSI